MVPPRPPVAFAPCPYAPGNAAICASRPAPAIRQREAMAMQFLAEKTLIHLPRWDVLRETAPRSRRLAHPAPAAKGRSTQNVGNAARHPRRIARHNSELAKCVW